jgi:hypothetical protein
MRVAPVVSGVKTWLAFVIAAGSVPAMASAAPPANDNFADAEVIASFPKAVPGSVPVFGRNDEATREPGEPQHRGVPPGGHSVWWNWTAPANVTVQMSVCGSGSGGVVAVYTGDAVESLTAVTAVYQPGSTPCQMRFRAAAGQLYHVVFDDPLVGLLQLNLERPPSNDDFVDAERIVGFPATARGNADIASREAGEPKHAGKAWASIWWRWAAPSTGATLVTTCGSKALAVYTGEDLQGLSEVVSDYGHGSCSSGSAVAFHAIAGREYRIAVAGSGGGIKLNLRRWSTPRFLMGRHFRAVLGGYKFSSTIFDVGRGGRTRGTRRNRVLGFRGRIAPPVLAGTPGRRYVCTDYHYRGRLFGREDPDPHGCGWGRVYRYAAMSRVSRHEAAAMTDRRLALRTRSMSYAVQKLREGRRHLEFVVDWMIGWGDDTFEDVEDAALSLEFAEPLFRRAMRAGTAAERHRLVRAARSWIRDSLETY